MSMVILSQNDARIENYFNFIYFFFWIRLKKNVFYFILNLIISSNLLSII
jgi:hypothetical protein